MSWQSEWLPNYPRWHKNLSLLILIASLSGLRNTQGTDDRYLVVGGWCFQKGLTKKKGHPECRWFYPMGWDSGLNFLNEESQLSINTRFCLPLERVDTGDQPCCHNGSVLSLEPWSRMHLFPLICFFWDMWSQKGDGLVSSACTDQGYESRHRICWQCLTHASVLPQVYTPTLLSLTM